MGLFLKARKKRNKRQSKARIQNLVQQANKSDYWTEEMNYVIQAIEVKVQDGRSMINRKKQGKQESQSRKTGSGINN